MHELCFIGFFQLYRPVLCVFLMKKKTVLKRLYNYIYLYIYIYIYIYIKLCIMYTGINLGKYGVVYLRSEVWGIQDKSNS